MAIGPRAAGVRRRAQLAQQAQLLERRLELRAGLAPLDLLQRAERRLDRRALPAAGEVRAQPCAEVAGAPDVERRARRGRGTGRRPAASARPRRASASTCRRRARGAASSTRSASVRAPRSWASPSSTRRISAVARASGSARWHGSVETPKKCASAARPTRRVRSPSSRRASQTVSTTGAAIRRPVSSSTSRSRKARSKRALCATSAASPANSSKRRIASSARGAPRSAAGLDAGQRGDRRRAAARGGRRASRTCPRARARGPAARRSRRSASSGATGPSSRGRRRRSARARAGRPRPAAPRARRRRRARRAARRPSTTSSRSERASAVRRAREREEDARRLVRGHRPAPGLDQLDEPVGGVERELHAADGRRTYVRLPSTGAVQRRTPRPADAAAS